MCFHLHNSLTFSNHLELGASVRQVEQGFECANFESSPSSCWPRCGKFETRTQLNSNETCNDSVMQRPGNSRKPCEVRSATPVPLLRIKGTLVRSITWLPITVELQVESVEVFFLIFVWHTLGSVYLCPAAGCAMATLDPTGGAGTLISWYRYLTSSPVFGHWFMGWYWEKSRSFLEKNLKLLETSFKVPSPDPLVPWSFTLLILLSPKGSLKRPQTLNKI